MIARIRYVAIRLFVFLLALNAFMFFQQPSITFYPFEELVATPADWQLAYEDVSLTTADSVKIHGWYLPHTGSKKALLFLHGNGGNISHRGESLAIFHRLGFNVLIIDYRGYGSSEGSPSETGLFNDALAAWQYLTQRGFAANDIVVFGRSLGGSIAAKLAAEVQPGGLILESTFSSARDLANMLFPVLSHMVILRYDFATAQYVKQVQGPVMVVHSPEDDVIPFHLGEKVFQAANQPKFFTRISGDHNYGFIQSQPVYEQSLKAFTDKVYDSR